MNSTTLGGAEHEVGMGRMQEITSTRYKHATGSFEANGFENKTLAGFQRWLRVSLHALIAMLAIVKRHLRSGSNLPTEKIICWWQPKYTGRFDEPSELR